MTHDPVADTSARLLALGVPAAERLAALRVLGALVDGAGPWGMVQPDPEALAPAVESDPDTVTHLIALLDRAGAIEPHDDRWRIIGAPARPHDGPSVAMAMAILADEIGHTPQRRRRLVPITAAAAMIAVILGGLTMAGRQSPGGTGDRQVAAEPLDTSGRGAAPPTVTAPAGADGAAPTPAGEAASAARGVVSAQPGTDSAGEIAGQRAASCDPVTLVATVRRLPDDMSDPVVAGTVDNPSADEVELSTVTVDGTDLTLEEPVIVPAGSSAIWTVPADPGTTAALGHADPTQVEAVATGVPTRCA